MESKLNKKLNISLIKRRSCLAKLLILLEYCKDKKENTKSVFSEKGTNGS
jgi:hypothetical protein